MTIEVWLTFVVTAFVILIMPGPTIIYVVGQSLTHGKKVSVPLSIGVISGDALCISLSLMGVSVLLTLFSTAFLIIKYIGAIYLIYLGIKMIKANTGLNSEGTCKKPYNSKSIFRDVFLVNALNPKGIIFYSAFMPQFVNPQQNITLQFSILSFTFLALALINVLGYSLIASKTRNVFNSHRFTKMFIFTGGLSLICAGLYSVTIDVDL